MSLVQRVTESVTPDTHKTVGLLYLYPFQPFVGHNMCLGQCSQEI